LNASEGCVNIANGTLRLSQCALAISNLILKYTNICVIVQICVLLHDIANTNSWKLPRMKTSNNY